MERDNRVVVIFRAKIANLEADYHCRAARLRELAMGQYGCLEFVTMTQGKDEIALSYWENLEQVKAWRQAPEHLEAQALGCSMWYDSHRVEVTEVLRSYGSGELVELPATQ